MQDPYTVLGVPRTADADAIKAAFRRLAKRCHPDSCDGDAAAARRFARLSAAYDLLSDREKRARFDRGEIDADGRPRFGHGHPFAGAKTRRGDPDARNRADEALFAEILKGLRGAGRQTPRRGGDIHARLTVSMAEAAAGTRRRLALPGGRTVEVSVPAGVAQGQRIRLRGQGEAGAGGGPDGDALVTVSVEAHPLFEADGLDLRLDLPITLDEAVLGARVGLPTLDGSVELKVPAGSSSGRTLRLKGKGLTGPDGAPGDLLVSLRIVLPDRSDPELKALMRRWREQAPYDVRGARFRNI